MYSKWFCVYISSFHGKDVKIASSYVTLNRVYDSLHSLYLLQKMNLKWSTLNL